METYNKIIKEKEENNRKALINTKPLEHKIHGYFMKGGGKWTIVEIDGNMLKGIDITPLGKIHTLYIHVDSVDNIVTIK